MIKNLIYLLKQDKKHILKKFFLKRFFKNFINLIRSYLKKQNYTQKNNLCYFNIKSYEDFIKEATDDKNVFIFGLSYCQRPKNCISPRFSNKCDFDDKNETCRDCFIAKYLKEKNLNDHFFIITDVRYISEKIIEILKKVPSKKLFFVISACRFSIEIFANFSNFLKIQGLALTLKGPVCNNFKSFEMAEKGKKFAVTSLDQDIENEFLQIIKIRKKVF